MRLAIVLTALVSLSATAEAQKKYVVAIYAPNAPFGSGVDRFNFVSRLAAQISSVAGVQAEGKAFRAAADMEKEIKEKKVDFAVVDGVYLAQRSVPYHVLATATIGGDTAPKWALFSSWATKVSDLRGKKIAFATTGPRDDDFINNALFDGEVQIKSFFSGGKTTAPDLASALEAVKLKRADAVFAPISEGKGLNRVAETDRVPNAAFCDMGSGTPADVVSKVKQAVLSHGVQAALDGWRSADSGPYRTLAGAMSPRSKRPIMAEPDVIKMEDLDILVPPTLETTLPALNSLYWNPTP
jgi:ABC-type amino acid transport substrate-binding protein